MSVNPNRGQAGRNGQPRQNIREQKPTSARNAQDERAQRIYEKAQQREQQKAQRAGANSGNGADGAGGGNDGKEKGISAFVKGTVKELKLTTWPKPAELVRWCLIVVATVGLLAVGAMVVDDLMTPLMVWVSSLNVNTDGSFGIVDIILIVVMFISGIAGIIGVYMHAGGDTEGLSDTMSARLTGGSGQAQKNLDRITLVCIIVFVLCLIIAMVIYPQGTIAAR